MALTKMEMEFARNVVRAHLKAAVDLNEADLHALAQLRGSLDREIFQIEQHEAAVQRELEAAAADEKPVPGSGTRRRNPRKAAATTKAAPTKRTATKKAK